MAMAIENPPLQVDVAATNGRNKSCRTDGAAPRSGVKSYQDESSNVPPNISLGFAVNEPLPSAPCRPKNTRCFGTGRPAFPLLILVRQPHSDDLRTETFASVMLDGRAEIF
jgi:hypothetical protein